MIKNFRKASFVLFSSIMLFAVLACNASVTVLNPTATPIPPTAESVPPTGTTAPLISQQVTLVSVPFNETDPGSNFPNYTITAQTPQLTGSDDPRVLAFNQRVNELVVKEVDMWRQSFQQLPITEYSNGSSLEVKYTLVSQINELWSFKFDFPFYSDGAAHPGLYSITLNYDLGQGRELALGDLFLPNSNYLETISNYCTAELSKQPYADSFSLDGAKPTLENYRNWNITNDGLMITFDTYQVAPGAAGPQTVLVPYDQLKSLIAPQGPLNNFAQ
jgi:hypothetical protein